VLVQDIGEKGLLEKLQRFCPPDMIGDDAAIMAYPPDKSLIVTTDMLIDGVHFSDRTTSPEDAGWRAAAANLSDLAAMGANPLGITVGLGLPGTVRVDWVERLYQGMTECLQIYHTPIVGGDIVRSPVITLAITALGAADPHLLIRRNAANAGDAIVVTGYHGASRAGLELLLHPEQGDHLSPTEKQSLIKAHQRPNPRLDVLPILDQVILNSVDIKDDLFNVAGMDSSDGLADAVLQICQGSRLGAILDYSKIPIPANFNSWLTPEQSLEYVLYGGEDFELVLCLPEIMALNFVEQMGQSNLSAAIIGRMQLDPAVRLINGDRQFPQRHLSRDQGFQHFSA